MDDEADSATMRIYTFTERCVAAILLVGMIAVVGMATYAFFQTLWSVWQEDGATLDYSRFQTLFDRVLAAVIALELARSIGQLVAGDHGLGQLRTVIVIGMLAVVRKLIVLEVEQATGGFLVGIAATVAALALGLVAIGWIERGRDAG